MASFYFERARFVVVRSEAGKSPHLRQLFQDVRLGTNGNQAGRVLAHSIASSMVAVEFSRKTHLAHQARGSCGAGSCVAPKPLFSSSTQVRV